MIENKISKYMMCSYAYYELNHPLISDGEFDSLARELLETIDDLPDHPHKDLLDKETLSAGTYLGEYPEIVKSATIRYINENRIRKRRK